MRTQNLMRHLAWGVLGLVSQQAYSQVTVPNNNGLGGAFVGWNAGANQILDVNNKGNQPIDFSTANRFRARINPQNTYPLLNSFTNIPADGFTLITPDDGFLTQVRGPFSRLHLAEGGTSGNAQPWGYRPWMKNGITFTGNQDQMFIGQKYSYKNPLDHTSGVRKDYTDAIIQWSDNPGTWLSDRMRSSDVAISCAEHVTARRSSDVAVPLQRDRTVGKGDRFSPPQGGLREDDPPEQESVPCGQQPVASGKFSTCCGNTGCNAYIRFA